MAKISKEKLIADIELKIHQGAPSQNTELEYDQIAYWLNSVLNEAVAREADGYMKKGEQVPPIYIETETCNQLAEEDVECVDDGKQRCAFELDGEVLDTDDDNGIVQILTPNENDEDIEIYKASLQALPMFKAMRYSQPNPQVLLWSRQGDQIFVDGLNPSDLEFNKITVYYLLKQDVLGMADTDLVAVSDKILQSVIDRVVDIAKEQMYGSEADQTNDGVDPKQLLYSRGIQKSVQE